MKIIGPIRAAVLVFASMTGASVAEEPSTHPVREIPTAQLRVTTRIMPPVEVKGKLYLTDMFGGYMLVFDLASQKFESRYALPGHGKRWQYAATLSAHGPFIDCSLSTFAGVPNDKKVYGFDGHTHHFVDRRLLFDTRDGSAAMVAVPSLSGDGYVTVAYSQPQGDSLYLTCVDSSRGEGRPKTERGPAYLVEMRVERVSPK